MKVLPLVGYKSLKALYAFQTLLLGLKMLPQYLGEDYKDFLASFNDMDEAKKETYIREAAAFVPLNEDEVKAMVCFCTDANGVPYTEVNTANLKPDELFEIIVAVAMEVGKIKIDLISESEKKKYQTIL